MNDHQIIHEFYRDIKSVVGTMNIGSIEVTVTEPFRSDLHQHFGRVSVKLRTATWPGLDPISFTDFPHARKYLQQALVALDEIEAHVVSLDLLKAKAEVAAEG